MTTLGNFTVGQTLLSTDMNIIGTWSSFTPTATGSINFTYTGSKCVLNKTCFFKIVGTAAATPTPPTAIQVPEPMQDLLSSVSCQFMIFRTSTSIWYQGMTQANSGAQVSLRVINTAGTYATGTGLTNIIPFAWAVGDQVVLTGVYRIA